MKTRIVRKSLGAIFSLIVLTYLAMLLMNTASEQPMNNHYEASELPRTITLFGATGTVGDGLLKAALNEPGVRRIHVITRRSSPRIEEGVASGRVEITLHNDYLDYSEISEILAETDSVFWAIGLSAVGLDEQRYREIHIDYPINLLSEWIRVNRRKVGHLSLHKRRGCG